MAAIQRLEADLAQSQEHLAQSQKYAQWAGPEIERLRAEVARLPSRISAATAEAKRLAVADEITRMLARGDDYLDF
jgi:capsule polysaccharide export protein KpsE/RkpR